jgi:hypothetical protein
MQGWLTHLWFSSCLHIIPECMLCPGGVIGVRATLQHSAAAAARSRGGRQVARVAPQADVAGQEARGPTLKWPHILDNSLLLPLPLTVGALPRLPPPPLPAPSPPPPGAAAADSPAAWRCPSGATHAHASRRHHSSACWAVNPAPRRDRRDSMRPPPPQQVGPWTAPNETV